MDPIPAELRKNILATFHEPGAAWLEQLPGLIRQFEARWSLQLEGPFSLSLSYCAPGIQAGGREIVLKLAFPDEENRQHTRALQAFDRRSMARLYEADPDQGAVLLERLRPGRMLVEEVEDDEQATRLAAGVMRALWIPAPADGGFPTMADWAQNFHRIHSLFRDQPCPLPARTIDRTEGLFKDLLDSEGPRYLLHGDLHHFNILSNTGEGGLGWRAIDPFGVIGEREVDVGAFMKNPNLALPFSRDLKRQLRRRLEIFHEELGLEKDRLAAWSSVYAAMSAWWTISTGADGWQANAALADFYAGLLD
jgi:streptomycin 6-kinase